LCACALLRTVAAFVSQTADATQYQATQENFAAELRRLGEMLKAAKIEHRTRGRTAKQAEQRLHTLQEELKTLLEVRYMTTVVLHNIDTMTDTLNVTQMLPHHVLTRLVEAGDVGMLACQQLVDACVYSHQE
jgi:L-asparaginase/Glu-tRNA(Gln) amidotransferase subunit D